MLLQALPQLGERRRKTPVTIDIAVIEGGWPSSQRNEVMDRIEDLLPLAIAAVIAGTICPSATTSMWLT